MKGAPYRFHAEPMVRDYLAEIVADHEAITSSKEA